MRSVDPLMTPAVTTGELLPPLTRSQQNNAGVARGQVQSQLWPSGGPAAPPAWATALTGVSLGVSTPALTGPATGTIPNPANMPCYQQTGNSCGTTTLAEIMTYLGVKMEQRDIDPSIRRMNG